MAGSWEFSNADREKTCTITFRNDRRQGRQARRVRSELRQAVSVHSRRSPAGGSSDNDFLRLLDAHGNSVLEFSEVENGIFEAPKPGEGILFIQNPDRPRRAAEDRRPDDRRMAVIVHRTGKRVCGLTLSDTAAGEEFVASPAASPATGGDDASAPADLADGSRRDRAACGQRPVLALRPRATTASGSASRRPRRPLLDGAEITRADFRPAQA